MDVETTGSFDDENEEQFVDRTSGEGTAVSFDVGLPPLDPKLRIPGEEPDAETEDDEDEDIEDSGSTRSKPKVPSKDDVQREYALEVGGVVYSNQTRTFRNSVHSSKPTVKLVKYPKANMIAGGC